MSARPGITLSWTGCQRIFPTLGSWRPLARKFYAQVQVVADAVPAGVADAGHDPEGVGSRHARLVELEVYDHAVPCGQVQIPLRNKRRAQGQAQSPAEMSLNLASPDWKSPPLRAGASRASPSLLS